MKNDQNPFISLQDMEVSSFLEYYLFLIRFMIKESSEDIRDDIVEDVAFMKGWELFRKTSPTKSSYDQIIFRDSLEEYGWKAPKYQHAWVMRKVRSLLV